MWLLPPHQTVNTVISRTKSYSPLHPCHSGQHQVDPEVVLVLRNWKGERDFRRTLLSHLLIHGLFLWGGPQKQ